MGCCTDMAEAICVGGAVAVDVEAGALLKVKGPLKGALAEPASQKVSELPTHTSRYMAAMKIKNADYTCSLSPYEQGLKRLCGADTVLVYGARQHAIAESSYDSWA